MHDDLFALQQKAVRVVANRPYIAHTDPIFNKYTLIKILTPARPEVRTHPTCKNVPCKILFSLTFKQFWIYKRMLLLFVFINSSTYINCNYINYLPLYFNFFFPTAKRTNYNLRNESIKLPMTRRTFYVQSKTCHT